MLTRIHDEQKAVKSFKENLTLGNSWAMSRLDCSSCTSIRFRGCDMGTSWMMADFSPCKQRRLYHELTAENKHSKNATKLWVAVAHILQVILLLCSVILNTNALSDSSLFKKIISKFLHVSLSGPKFPVQLKCHVRLCNLSSLCS